MVNTEIRLIIFFAVKDGEILSSQQKQDWERTVAEIMNSLLPNSTEIEQSGKTIRPFRYDLNQIPYDYIVEVRNRFKGLDLTHRVPDGLCMKVHDIVQENSYFYLICIGLIQSICVWSKIKVLAYLWSLNIVSSYYGNYIL